MEDFWWRIYRGDPGVPHTNPDRFVNTCMAIFAFSAVACFNSFMRQQLSHHFNWDDKALMFDHQHRKKAMEKQQQISLSGKSK
ncbi:uncharacterized protein [Elaeis guineensis]|uniref:Uncharacterized protein LOC105057548 n=1 Tax=Elaeis guineensis var. tenera TaxID=51953 RepID=A0A6J0PN00_ELAGV|nr:uncharacterized protein LOC105057548 [Elaeis guineensis]